MDSHTAEHSHTTPTELTPATELTPPTDTRPDATWMFTGGPVTHVRPLRPPSQAELAATAITARDAAQCAACATTGPLRGFSPYGSPKAAIRANDARLLTLVLAHVMWFCPSCAGGLLGPWAAGRSRVHGARSLIDCVFAAVTHGVDDPHAMVRAVRCMGRNCTEGSVRQALRSLKRAGRVTNPSIGVWKAA